MKINKRLPGPEIINSKHNPDLRKSFERNLQHQASDVRSSYIFSMPFLLPYILLFKKIVF